MAKGYSHATYSHSSYSHTGSGYTKTHVSGCGSKSQGSGYHYSSSYSSRSTAVTGHPTVSRSSYTSSNGTVHRSATGNDGKGHSFKYSGSYKKY